MKISIGADHRGFVLKQQIINHYTHVTWLDAGTANKKRVDYPVYAKTVCHQILGGMAERGILICGSGVGMAIAANRFNDIYAALCWNPEIARAAREDDGVNVLALPADVVTFEQAMAIIDAWFAAEFKSGHYQHRLAMIDALRI